MVSKKWWTSKTVWFNILTLAPLVLTIPEVVAIVPEYSWKYVLAFNAVANVVLRFFTTRAILNPPPPEALRD